MKQEHSVRLRQAREIRGWSRTYIAAQIGVDLGIVGRWERGEHLPHPDYRQKLCDLFEKSAQDLGLLPEELDEDTDTLIVLDPHYQASSINEQRTITSLAAEWPLSTDYRIGEYLWVNLAVERGESTDEVPPLIDPQSRQQMLRKMYSFWIKGVLEQSLHGADLIALNLVERPGAVIDPWISMLQPPEGTSRPLAASTHISEVYDEVDGELLILGAPGCGKTTLLLDLTRTLLERAHREQSHPLPLIFNLASWAARRRPLDEWLVEELCVKYQVPRKLARVWIQEEQILPLLDGLDEVSASARSACIEKINVYRRTHSLLPMVVCCRQADYFAQDARLLLRCGVVVQPLAAQQIDSYLARGDEQFSTLRRALQVDPVLQELASNPLMLSILVLTYQDEAIETNSKPLFLEVRRREVFAAYVRRMLTHRRSKSRYTAEQTRNWLSWLARQLIQQQQAEFYIERMQPAWLSSPRAFRWYCRLLVGVLMGLLGGITAALADVPLYETIHMRVFMLFSHSAITASQCADTLPAFGTAAETIASLISLPIVGLCYGIAFGLLGGFFACGVPRPRFIRVPPRLSSIYRLGSALLLGLGCGSLFVLVNLLWVPCPLASGLYNQVAEELSYGLAGVVAGGLLGVLTGDLFGMRKTQIQPVEALVWTQAFDRRRVISLLLGGALGILIGGGTELACEVYLQFVSWQQYFLISALIGGLLGMVIGGGIGGFSRQMVKETSLVKPNEGIQRSMRNALIIGLPIGLTLSGFAVGLTWWLIPAHLSDGLLWGIPLGLIVTLLLVLLNGGYACLQHVILRVILFYQGHIPWLYTRFLDEATDKLLLRKVGGGYIFIHRLLLDYFASLEDS